MPHLARARQLQVICLLLGILWAGHSFSTAQAQPGEATDTQVYDFGLHLFRLGDYYRAITEFKRFSLLFPQHERQPAAELLIGLAFQEDKAYDDAFAHFQHWRLVDDPTDATRVATLSWNCRRTSGGGPMNTSPCSLQTSAKSAFSDRKPYPG